MCIIAVHGVITVFLLSVGPEDQIMDIGSRGSSLGLHSGTSLNVKGMLYSSREVIRKSCPWTNIIALGKVSRGHLISPRIRFTDHPLTSSKACPYSKDTFYGQVHIWDHAAAPLHARLS